MTKRTAITVLLGLNLLLLVALLSSVLKLPTAFAQAGGRRGGFVCVSAKAAGQSYDVLYALDLSSRKLHAFHPASTRGKTTVIHADTRDLAVDFGRQGTAPNP